ncbi:hypothetical protein [Bacillus thuringiensis]|uniref:hypothetical protein n=1 Tax=Bacillus thuringiensis TaxID=1428 RepID=UPI0011A2BCB9|nr:hypothetical protein [Bacillus thuringiensis]
MKKSILWRLAYYNLNQTLFQTKLYVFISISIFLAFMSSKLMSNELPDSSTLNFWDGVFSFIGNYQINLFLLVLYFLYSIIKVLYDNDEVNIFIRLISKEQWLFSKIITICIHSLVAVLLFYLIPLVVNLILLPYDASWSEEVANVLAGKSPLISLPHMDFSKAFSPIFAFILSFLLTMMALNIIGLFNIFLFMMFNKKKTVVIAINIVYLIFCYICYHYIDLGFFNFISIYDFMVLEFFYYKPHQLDFLTTFIMLYIIYMLLFIFGRLLARRWSIL